MAGSDSKTAQELFDLGRAVAAHAFVQIALDVGEDDGGDAADGVLARALIVLLNDFNEAEDFERSKFCRDNLIKGFCADIQRRFIERDINRTDR